MPTTPELPRGSIVALVTPMHDDGSVDYDALRALVDWHVEQGTDCIGVVGTTGESPTVDVEEHCEIIRVAVEQAAGRVPVMAGCGGNSTREAIALAQFARQERIKYATFAGWVAKVQRSPAKPALIKFSEVKLPVPPREASSAMAIEVRLPDGTVLRGERVTDLVALVRALRN